MGNSGSGLWASAVRQVSHGPTPKDCRGHVTLWVFLVLDLGLEDQSS